MAFQPSLPGLAPPCRPEPARTARAALARYPDVVPDDLCTHAKVLGLAGEHLLDSVLAMLGERAIPTPEHEQFDRMVWLDQRLLRVQIKTRHVLGAGGYVFNVRRGYQRGPVGTRPYDPGDFDMLALVALPDFVVKFTSDWRQAHRIHTTEIPGLRRRPPGRASTPLCKFSGLPTLSRTRLRTARQEPPPPELSASPIHPTRRAMTRPGRPRHARLQEVFSCPRNKALTTRPFPASPTPSCNPDRRCRTSCAAASP